MEKNKDKAQKRKEDEKKIKPLLKELCKKHFIKIHYF